MVFNSIHGLFVHSFFWCLLNGGFGIWNTFKYPFELLLNWSSMQNYCSAQNVHSNSVDEYIPKTFSKTISVACMWDKKYMNKESWCRILPYFHFLFIRIWNEQQFVIWSLAWVKTSWILHISAFYFLSFPKNKLTNECEFCISAITLWGRGV